ncbi:MAG TPA: hypothetical protein ENN88_00010 [Candidatus Coatesbacteria bacterium]|nr:hypothetical protein [Candidatus Coatesbacteria bacterium]
MPPEEVYFSAVCRLLSERFGYPLALSPKNAAQVMRWYEAGVPLAAVLEGVAESLNRKRSGRLTPLAYCTKAVKSASKKRRRF